MTNLEPINKRGPTDRGYIAGLNGKKVAFWAQSLADAKQTAIEYFRPKKRDRNLIWVELADSSDEEE